MKNSIILTGFTLIVVTITLNSCKKEELPTLSTSSISNITASSASSGGNIASDGGAAVTARGVCWSANENPATSDSKTIDGSGTGQYVSNLSGLNSGSTYHVRSYASNSAGTAYGADILFATLGQVPEAITQPATNISAAIATLNGTVNANYLSTTVTFEYGTTTSYNSTVTPSQSPVTGNSSTNIYAHITGLIPTTIYHFRIKSVNSLGTTYSNDLTFTTTSSSTVIDVEGNIYNTITIGTQVWMAENLKTTKYNDGTVIPNIINGAEWASLTTGAYSDYRNTPANSTTYGRLYNWFAVNIGKLCPTGWHAPSDAEWTALTDYLSNNGYGYQGNGSDIGKSMAAISGWTTYGTAGTVGNDQASNNSSGFTALPVGIHEIDGTFSNPGISSSWWSSTDLAVTSQNAFYRSIFYDNSIVFRVFGTQRFGISVRCLQDL